MKVYAVMCHECLMPYMVEHLISLHKVKEDADERAEQLEKDNINKMERDEYGPYMGEEYLVREYEVS